MLKRILPRSLKPIETRLLKPIETRLNEIGASLKTKTEKPKNQLGEPKGQGRRKLPYPTAASVKNSTTSPAAIKRAERMAMAMDFRRKCYSFPKIADALGISISTAHELVDQGIKLIRQEPAEQLVKMEIERCDQIFRAYYPAALKGDIQAAGVCLRAMDQRAKYLGLYAPAKIATQVSGPNGRPAEIDHEFRIVGIDPKDMDSGVTTIEHKPPRGNGPG